MDDDCTPMPRNGEIQDASAVRLRMEAVYLGVEGYGTVTSAQRGSFRHRFSVCGETKLFQISTAAEYAIQNCMEEGGLYRIIVENCVVTGADLSVGTGGSVTAMEKEALYIGGERFAVDPGTRIFKITVGAGGACVTPAVVRPGDCVRIFADRGETAREIYIVFPTAGYTPPVCGTPGRRTLRNFLATALAPVGTVLYLFGGGWNWQDTGSDCRAEGIGLSPSWIRFFQSQDAAFTYKNPDPAHSYYPFGGWNQYHYAGLDCSGYVGWAVYNTLNYAGGLGGWVMSAKKMARTFSENGWGIWMRTVRNFRPGDVFSMSGHVWICLGTCPDGSVVIVHSTPSVSRSGWPGGGVQISALNPAGGKSCEAYHLADRYMTEFYPRWSGRYEAVVREYGDYTTPTVSGPDAEWSGLFRWNLNGGVLADPDGSARMTAGALLADLFDTGT